MYVERYITPEDLATSKEISNLLRSHGVLERRRCRLIHFIDCGGGGGGSDGDSDDDNDGDSDSDSGSERMLERPWYQLTQDQSDRIIIYEIKNDYNGKPRDSRSSNHALIRVIVDIRSSLTEADIVDESTYASKSLPKSEVDDSN